MIFASACIYFDEIYFQLPWNRLLKNIVPSIPQIHNIGNSNLYDQYEYVNLNVLWSCTACLDQQSILMFLMLSNLLLIDLTSAYCIIFYRTIFSKSYIDDACLNYQKLDLSSTKCHLFSYNSYNK